MKSPFPGMDPYMERRWRSAHTRIIVYAAAALNSQLGGPFVADIEERLVVERLPDEWRPINPDGYVLDMGERYRAGGGGTAVAAAPAMNPAMGAGPLLYERPTDPRPQRYLEIIDPEGGEVVTVLEFLSPTNKVRGDGRRQYRRKQREALEANINFVEIDLTRHGRRELALMPPEAARATYLACVTRGFDRRGFEVYPMSLRQPLPPIRIPLRGDVPDVLLPLQPLVDQAYAEGHLSNLLNYAVPLAPPLPPDDAAWAAALLAAAGVGDGARRGE